MGWERTFRRKLGLAGVLFWRDFLHPNGLLESQSHAEGIELAEVFEEGIGAEFLFPRRSEVQLYDQI